MNILTPFVTFLNRSKLRYEKNDKNTITELYLTISFLSSSNFKNIKSIFTKLGAQNNLEKLVLHIRKLNLDQEQILSLLNEFPKFKNLHTIELKLHQSSLRREGMGYFIKNIMSLSKLTTLELNLRNSYFSDDGIYIFSLGLVNLVFLKSLKLKLNGVKSEGEGVWKLIENISEMRNLESLALFCSEMNEEFDNIKFHRNFRTMLKKMKKLVFIKDLTLDFSRNNLTPIDIVLALKLFLKNLYFSNLRALNLNLAENCEKGSWEVLAEELKEKSEKIIFFKSIDKLIVNLSKNSIEDHHFKYFCNILAHYKEIFILKLKMHKNLLNHGVCNLFSFYSLFSRSTETMQSMELTLLSNDIKPEYNLSININNIPLYSKLKELKLTTQLPKMHNIDKHFTTFLNKFSLLENLSLILPQTCENSCFSGISEHIMGLTSLKKLEINLNMNKIQELTISEFFQNLCFLPSLQELQFSTINTCVRMNDCINSISIFLENAENLYRFAIYCDKSAKFNNESFDLFSFNNAKFLAIKCYRTKKFFVEFDCSYPQIKKISTKKVIGIYEIASLSQHILKILPRKLIVIEIFESFLKDSYSESALNIYR